MQNSVGSTLKQNQGFFEILLLPQTSSQLIRCCVQWISSSENSEPRLCDRYHPSSKCSSRIRVSKSASVEFHHGQPNLRILFNEVLLPISGKSLKAKINIDD